MISLAEAKALVAEAQAWFTGLSISPVKQNRWAQAFVESRLDVYDVCEALKRIAIAPREGYWRLELAEILQVARIVYRERKENNDFSRLELPSRATPDPEQTIRNRIAMQVASDIALKRIHGVTFEHEFARRMAAHREGNKK